LKKVRYSKLIEGSQAMKMTAVNYHRSIFSLCMSIGHGHNENNYSKSKRQF